MSVFLFFKYKVLSPFFLRHFPRLWRKLFLLPTRAHPSFCDLQRAHALQNFYEKVQASHMDFEKAVSDVYSRVQGDAGSN